MLGFGLIYFDTPRPPAVESIYVTAYSDRSEYPNFEEGSVEITSPDDWWIASGEEAMEDEEEMNYGEELNDEGN